MLHELVLRGKLHFIYNEREELLNFIINPGDVNDIPPLNTSPLWNSSMKRLSVTRDILAGIFFEKLFVDGIQLIN